MAGSGSRSKLAAHECPTLSHVPAASGTMKTRVDWGFVSGVSRVSPYLKLMEGYRMGEWGKAMKGISWRPALFAETSGTGARTTRVSR